MNKQSGFSLVEIVIAAGLGILVIGGGLYFYINFGGYGSDTSTVEEVEVEESDTNTPSGNVEQETAINNPPTPVEQEEESTSDSDTVGVYKDESGQLTVNSRIVSEIESDLAYRIEGNDIEYTIRRFAKYNPQAQISERTILDISDQSVDMSFWIEPDGDKSAIIINLDMLNRSPTATKFPRLILPDTYRVLEIDGKSVAIAPLLVRGFKTLAPLTSSSGQISFSVPQSTGNAKLLIGELSSPTVFLSINFNNDSYTVLEGKGVLLPQF